MTLTRFANFGFFLFIIAAVLPRHVHAQTPTVQEFYQALVDHYDPSSPPTLENLIRVTDQIAGARPEEITRALPAIFAAMAHQDEAVKHNALTGLFEIARRPDGAGLLKSRVDTIGRDFLASPNPDTRGGEMIILGMLQPPPPEVLPIFLTFLKRTDNDAQAQGSGVIFQLVQIAPENPEVIAAVREFLSRPLDNKSRIDALNALGNPSVKDAQVIAMVTSSLDDSDPGVRSTAIQALGRMGSQALRQAESALEQLAADPKQPAEVTAKAKEALQQLHSGTNKK